jgi:hypothetical protein
MKNNIHIWPYLFQFFLEWQMFQKKVLEKIKTHVLCSINLFLENRAANENVDKYCRAWQATDVSMAHAHYILDT